MTTNPAAGSEPANLLIILSDEHNPQVMGSRGHPAVRTPNLDRLASAGTSFTEAQCLSPICVPARAALATGRPVHETGYWDNVNAYDGRTRSWHHVLREHGHEVVSIGKLHYRGHEGDDYGWTASLLPMHIHKGRGEPRMLLRNPPCPLGDGSNMLTGAKAGTSDYNLYDDSICEAAEQWLTQKAEAPQSKKPWVLMVSMVAPHFPLTVPAPWFDLYKDQPLDLPKNYVFGIDDKAHPFIREYARQSGYNLHFKNEADVRRALSGYYGLISCLDHNAGRLLNALAAAGLERSTRVMYLSDHGDNTGARGLWGKSTMYKESVGVPLILRGPGIDAGRADDTPVSHLDVYNTVLDCVGVPLSASTASAQSASLLGPLDPNRITFAEYHTVGSGSAVFMLRDRHFKFVYYIDYPPQLFDLRNDPEELNDLGRHPDHQATVRAWTQRLYAECDPLEVDRRAKARQAEMIELFGGEQAIRNGEAIGGYTPVPAR